MSKNLSRECAEAAIPETGNTETMAQGRPDASAPQPNTTSKRKIMPTLQWLAKSRPLEFGDAETMLQGLLLVTIIREHCAKVGHALLQRQADLASRTIREKEGMAFFIRSGPPT